MPTRCYRCHYCGRILPAWLPMAKRPNGAMLPGASQRPCTPQRSVPTWRACGRMGSGRLSGVGALPYLARMRTEDIGTVAAEAYEVVEV
jgi:hypothetical protein